MRLDYRLRVPVSYTHLDVYKRQDKALVGTVKETVMQVSRSKKWASKPLLDDAGKPVLQKSGKPVLKKSYSVLQEDSGRTAVAKTEEGGDDVKSSCPRCV